MRLWFGRHAGCGSNPSDLNQALLMQAMAVSRIFGLLLVTRFYWSYQPLNTGAHNARRDRHCSPGKWAVMSNKRLRIWPGIAAIQCRPGVQSAGSLSAIVTAKATDSSKRTPINQHTGAITTVLTIFNSSYISNSKYSHYWQYLLDALGTTISRDRRNTLLPRICRDRWNLTVHQLIGPVTGFNYPFRAMIDD